MTPIRRYALWGVLLLAALCGPAWPADPPPAVKIEPSRLIGHQGGVVAVTLTLPGDPPAGAPTPALMGRFGDESVPFYPLDRSGRFGALVGIDLAASVGKRPFTIRLGDRPLAETVVTVQRQKFPVQTLTLPREMVDLDPETVARANKEQQEALEAMAPQTPTRWWSGAFIVPTDGPLQHMFGSRRIINGEPRNAHTGEDISAPEGAPVLASNDGVVSLVADHFFSGHSIFIDHGEGLFTMYFHLSKVAVTPSQRVHKGDIIGYVGKSGRATGPHLHWGARLNGTRVNPFDLVRATVSAP